MLTSILKKVFGTKSQRDLKRMKPLVERVKQLEESYQKLSEEELLAKTPEFQQRLRNGETTDDIMCEAFAVLKNACRRMCGREIDVCGQKLIWDMVPFDVQILGAIALHKGNIAEMATGEGKTLVATMPLYLNALTGRNCQLVTVNDYLARRDSEWMGAVYRYLGLTVGCLQNMQPPSVRREQYLADITYGTNSEFGFDYLRDMGMAGDASQLVQRDHFYAIIDEIDSILIDEARTPLIISGPVPMSTHQFDVIQPLVADVFQRQNLLCSRLIKEARETLAQPSVSDDDKEAALTKLLQVKFGMPTHKQMLHMLEDGSLLRDLERIEARVRSDNNRGMLQEVQSVLYFAIDEKSNEADLTEKGRNAISPNNPEAFILPDLLAEIHRIENDPALTEEERLETRKKFEADYSVQSERLHDLGQLLKAYCLFERDVDYVVQNGKVMIVDEHTGRMMPGRRFSDGLHQALEAKENVTIEQETQTMATITIQNYFRLYEKLAGMTGTAETEANEFHQIYKLDVIVIPPNRRCPRKDDQDLIFTTRRDKFNAIVQEVARCHTSGQPVLLGTISVEDSEILSRMLKRQNIPHNVLNAKNHQHEAEIVARAGQPGAVTVATNMAGRGTDIKLGPGVAQLGGLRVIGSSRHDSRRIDRQLRGRCSRQGDPGASAFFVSLEDNLMRLFGSDRIIRIFERFGPKEGEGLADPWLSKSIEMAQKRVEQHHFSIRKRTLEFDDVMNKQRGIVYGLRKEALLSECPGEVLMGLVEELLINEVELIASLPSGERKSGFDWDKFISWLNATFPLHFKREDLTAGLRNGEVSDQRAFALDIARRVESAYREKNAGLPEEDQRWLERRTVLEALDRLWQQHLYTMDHLRSNIYLRVYAQRDPLVEYKNEAYLAFQSLMTEIQKQAASSMFTMNVARMTTFEDLLKMLPKHLVHRSFNQFEEAEMPETGGGSDLPPEAMIEAEKPEIQVTFRRQLPKVGANDLCPCGSGKKYKKCCGQ